MGVTDTCDDTIFGNIIVNATTAPVMCLAFSQFDQRPNLNKNNSEYDDCNLSTDSDVPAHINDTVFTRFEQELRNPEAPTINEVVNLSEEITLSR